MILLWNLIPASLKNVFVYRELHTELERTIFGRKLVMDVTLQKWLLSSV